ncbi:MAG: hypothetical protein ACYDCK_02815 [Thermoplasmatota archaeon]
MSTPTFREDVATHERIAGFMRAGVMHRTVQLARALALLSATALFAGCASSSPPATADPVRLGASSVALVDPTWKVAPDGLDFNAWVADSIGEADLDFGLDVAAPQMGAVDVEIANVTATFEGATTPVALDASWSGHGADSIGAPATATIAAGESGKLGARLAWRDPAEALRRADPSLFSALTPNFAGRAPTFEVLQRHVQLGLSGEVRVTQPNGTARAETQSFNLSFALLVERPAVDVTIHEGQVFPSTDVDLGIVPDPAPQAHPQVFRPVAVAWGDATTGDVLVTRQSATVTLSKGPHAIETLTWNGFSFDLKSTNICIESC